MSNKICIVQFDYRASEADEITLYKGDKVIDVELCSDQEGWCTGTNQSTSETGLFPDNFVKFVETARSRETSGNENNPPSTPNTSNTPHQTSSQPSKPAPPPSSKKPSLGQPQETTNNNDTSNNDSNKKHKVTFAYKADNNDELSLQIGDVVEFFKDIEEGWAEGKCNGKVGLYPTNFVTEIKNNPSILVKPSGSAAVEQQAGSRLVLAEQKEQVLAAKLRIDQNTIDTMTDFLRNSQGKRLLKADFPYKANNKDELSFKKGDIVSLVNEDGGDPGWWKGELNGKIGVFPDNFVTGLKVGDSIPGLPAIKTPGKSFKNDAMVQDLKQKIGSKSATTTPMTDTPIESKISKTRPMSEHKPSSDTLNSTPSIAAAPVARRPKPQNKRPPTRKPRNEFKEDDIWNGGLEKEHGQTGDKLDSDGETEPEPLSGPTPSQRNKPAVGGVRMPGLGADFTNVLRKRHQEVTTSKSEPPKTPAAAAIPTSVVSPATSPTSEKPKPESSDKPAWMKNLVAKRQSAFIDEKTVETALKSPDDSDESPKIKPKASVKDRMRNFQGLNKNNDKPVPVVDSAINRSAGLARPSVFGKIKENVVKEKIEEKVEVKKVELKKVEVKKVEVKKVVPEAQPAKRSISPPSKQVVIPLKDSHNTSSSAANTSTDSTQSDFSHGKSKPTATSPTISPTVRANFTGNLTLPQLSKLIQQQAQLITELQSENKTLNKRVDDLERFVKQ